MRGSWEGKGSCRGTSRECLGSGGWLQGGRGSGHAGVMQTGEKGRARADTGSIRERSGNDGEQRARVGAQRSCGGEATYWGVKGEEGWDTSALGGHGGG